MMKKEYKTLNQNLELNQNRNLFQTVYKKLFLMEFKSYVPSGSYTPHTTPNRNPDTDPKIFVIS